MKTKEDCMNKRHAMLCTLICSLLLTSVDSYSWIWARKTTHYGPRPRDRSTHSVFCL